MHNITNLPQDEKDKVNADLAEITGNKKPAGAGLYWYSDMADNICPFCRLDMTGLFPTAIYTLLMQ